MASVLRKAKVSDLEHLQLAIAAGGVTLWTWNVDSDELTMDDRAFDLWGVARSAHVAAELANLGFTNERGAQFSAPSIQSMLAT